MNKKLKISKGLLKTKIQWASGNVNHKSQQRITCKQEAYPWVPPGVYQFVVVTALLEYFELEFL